MNVKWPIFFKNFSRTVLELLIMKYINHCSKSVHENSLRRFQELFLKLVIELFELNIWSFFFNFICSHFVFFIAKIAIFSCKSTTYLQSYINCKGKTEQMYNINKSSCGGFTEISH